MLRFGYSPFTDESGNSLNIYEIEYEHLKQLKERDIAEGLYVEYKLELSSSVKKKFPKSICSFANEQGGWYLVGVDNAQKTIHPVDEQNYEEMANNMLKESCSPVPTIIVRFVHDPTSAGKGVVIAWIPEGEAPPYIANGSVYRRIGSTSSPIHEVRNRFELDALYNKAEQAGESFTKFCSKEISITNRRWLSSIRQYQHRGMCNIYIMPQFAIDLPSIKKPYQLVQYFKEISQRVHNYTLPFDGEFGFNVPFHQSSYSLGSIVFRNASEIDYFESTIGWEQLYDGSAKFHIPVKYIDARDQHDNIINRVKKIIPNYIGTDVLDHLEIVDGAALITHVIGCFGQYTRAMKGLWPRFKSARIRTVITHVAKDILYFDSDTYEEFISENGISLSDKNSYQIDMELDVDDDEFLTAFFPFTEMFNAFGYPIGKGLEFYFENISKKFIQK